MTTSKLNLAFLTAFAAALSGLAFAQTSTAPCPPHWMPVFGSTPAVSGAVHAMIKFNDGSGERLVCGGSFGTIGGVHATNVARWDGTSWSPMGQGLSGSGVLDFEVFDDGQGPALYAAGGLTSSGSTALSCVARWNAPTNSWVPLAGSIDGPNTWVASLAVHDDGTGPALFATGWFTSVNGGSDASKIAKWNGVAWSPLGGGLGEPFGAGYSLASFADQTGPALYVGGAFSSAGGQATNSFAKWQSGHWIVFPQAPVDSFIASLRTWNDGNGDALYVGSWSGVHRFDGSTWSLLGHLGVFGGNVEALHVHDDGGGPALFATGGIMSANGSPAQNAVKWTGSAWDNLAGGFSTRGWCMETFNDGGLDALFFGNGTTSFPPSENGLRKWGTTPNCEPLSYCAPSTTSSGCVPVCSATGRASLASPSSFVIHTSQVDANRFGLQVFSVYFPGTSNAGAGKLCVAFPLYRLLPKNSMGASGCSGNLDYSLAEVLAQPDGGPLVLAGLPVNQQCWYRDPSSPTGSAFSNALQYMVMP